MGEWMVHLRKQRCEDARDAVAQPRAEAGQDELRLVRCCPPVALHPIGSCGHPMESHGHSAAWMPQRLFPSEQPSTSSLPTGSSRESIVMCASSCL